MYIIDILRNGVFLSFVNAEADTVRRDLFLRDVVAYAVQDDDGYHGPWMSKHDMNAFCGAVDRGMCYTRDAKRLFGFLVGLWTSECARSDAHCAVWGADDAWNRRIARLPGLDDLVEFERFSRATDGYVYMRNLVDDFVSLDKCNASRAASIAVMGDATDVAACLAVGARRDASMLRSSVGDLLSSLWDKAVADAVSAASSSRDEQERRDAVHSLLRAYENLSVDVSSGTLSFFDRLYESAARDRDAFALVGLLKGDLCERVRPEFEVSRDAIIADGCLSMRLERTALALVSNSRGSSAMWSSQVDPRLFPFPLCAERLDGLESADGRSAFPYLSDALSSYRAYARDHDFYDLLQSSFDYELVLAEREMGSAADVFSDTHGAHVFLSNDSYEASSGSFYRMREAWGAGVAPGENPFVGNEADPLVGKTTLAATWSHAANAFAHEILSDDAPDVDSLVRSLERVACELGVQTDGSGLGVRTDGVVRRRQALADAFGHVCDALRAAEDPVREDERVRHALLEFVRASSCVHGRDLIGREWEPSGVEGTLDASGLARLQERMAAGEWCFTDGCDRIGLLTEAELGERMQTCPPFPMSVFESSHEDESEPRLSPYVPAADDAQADGPDFGD